MGVRASVLPTRFMFFGAALVAVLTVLAAGAGRAQAATCDNTWIGGGSGLWLNTANWADGDADPNNNVPGLDDNVCITASGTYTVTIIDNGVFNSGSAKSITVGDGNDANGKVTLSISSSTNNFNNPVNGSLNGLSEDSTIASDGILELTGAGSNPGQAELQSASAIDNSGIVRSAAGSGGGRLFNIELNNLPGGTVDIAHNAAQGFTRTWTNEGTFNVADGKQFTFTGNGGGPTFNQDDGTIATNATGLFYQDSGTFNHTGGSTSGTNPIQLCGPALNAPSGGSGSYEFVRKPAGFCGGGTITGNIGTGKTVKLNNDSNNAMGVSVTAPITNNGTVILAGPSEDQFLGSAVTNNGTFRVSGSGGRLIGNSFTNSATGTIDIDESVNFGFTPTITNNGAIDIADGKTMYVTGSGQGPTFNQSGGTIATNASGALFMSGGTFNHTGGSTSGTKPIQLCGPALNAPSGGSGSYDFIRDPANFCGGGTISGNIGSGKTVRLNNDSNNAMGVNLSGAQANNGTLVLTGSAEDQLGGSALTNNGTLRVAAGGGGRQVFVSVTNSATGTIDVDESVNFGQTPTITNNGEIEIADGKTMYVTGSGQGPTFNQSGGTIASNTSGVLLMTGGTFNHTGGSTSGNPIQLCGPALNAPSGGSASYDFVRITAQFCGGGTITGDIGTGKTVRLNNDSNAAMGVTVSTPIQNNGTLVLTGPSEDQFFGSPVTNNGLFHVTGSGARLTGNSFTNSAAGTIDVDQDVNFGFTPTITNNGAIDVASGKTMYLTGSGGGPVFNQSDGTMNVVGTFNHGGGAYNHSGGTTTIASSGQITTNNNPIALSGGTMRGTGTIAASNVNNTGGTVHPGNSPGILNITGNYTQGAGGTLAVDIAGTTAGTGYSRLAVGGGASLGGELDITNAVSSLSGTQFQVLTGGVSGTFATLDVHGGLPNYNAQYNAGDVTLVAKGPAVPNPTGTTPASGANDNAPKVTGTAEAGSTVRLYTNANCTGTPVATGSAAQFASPGITVNVADNSTTTFRADATNADGKSGCSTGSVTYDEVTPPPAGKVTFSKGPAKKSTKKKAKFTFSAPNAASYECNLDGKGYKPCTSPFTVKKLKPRKHKLQARAIGADGSPGAAATYKWTVKKKKKK